MAKRAESQASKIKRLQAELGEARSIMQGLEEANQLLRITSTTAQRQATELVQEKEDLEYLAQNLRAELADAKDGVSFERGIGKGWEHAIKVALKPMHRIADAVAEKITELG